MLLGFPYIIYTKFEEALIDVFSQVFYLGSEDNSKPVQSW